MIGVELQDHVVGELEAQPMLDPRGEVSAVKVRLPT